MVNFVLKFLRNLTKISPKLAKKKCCPSKSGHIYMKDVTRMKNADTNEKSNLPIFFQLWSILYLKFTESSQCLHLNNQFLYALYVYEKKN